MRTGDPRPTRPATPDGRRRRLPGRIELYDARAVASLTAPDITAKGPGGTASQAAFHTLEQHVHAVADHQPADDRERKKLVRYMLTDTMPIAVEHRRCPVVTIDAVDWMTFLIGDRSALEVGAGPDVISAELKARGVAVTAADLHPPGQRRDRRERDRYRFEYAHTRVENSTSRRPSNATGPTS